MVKWCIIGKAVDQPALADELTRWLERVDQGVYLFREGPTLSRFDWGDNDLITRDQLDELWIVRLFCPEYEVYARRTGHVGETTWQMRVAAGQTHLTTGQAMTPLGDEETSLLLGQATGAGTDFEQKPKRYQRAQLRYPGTWLAGQRCGLVARRFQPAEGGSLLCWNRLTAIQDATA